MVSAQVGHDVLVLTLLHHGDLLLDGRDVIAWQRQTDLCVEVSWNIDLCKSKVKKYLNKLRPVGSWTLSIDVIPGSSLTILIAATSDVLMLRAWGGKTRFRIFTCFHSVLMFLDVFPRFSHSGLEPDPRRLHSATTVLWTEAVRRCNTSSQQTKIHQATSAVMLQERIHTFIFQQFGFFLATVLTSDSRPLLFTETSCTNQEQQATQSAGPSITTCVSATFTSCFLSCFTAKLPLTEFQSEVSQTGFM